MSERSPEKPEDLGSTYAAMGVGLAFVVAAVLIAITAGAPAAAFPFLIPGFGALGWGDLTSQATTTGAPKAGESGTRVALRHPERWRQYHPHRGGAGDLTERA